MIKRLKEWLKKIFVKTEIVTVYEKTVITKFEDGTKTIKHYRNGKLSWASSNDGKFFGRRPE